MMKMFSLCSLNIFEQILAKSIVSDTNKHSSLLLTSLNYRQKSFVRMATGQKLQISFEIFTTFDQL
jgi:hypothetical protein